MPRAGAHAGYVAGYFRESAINHYVMTNKKDDRLYNAAKKLADCWYDNLSPPPKAGGKSLMELPPALACRVPW